LGGDLNALMLLLLSIGDRDGLKKLANGAVEKGQNNLAFAALFQLGDKKSCVDLLVKTQRIPEAAIFARTYAPSLVPKVVETWREDLVSRNRPKLAARIASPSEQPNVFGEGWEDVLEAEWSSRSDGVLVDL